MSDGNAQFRTFQTVQNYESALARHGQWCRWTKVLTCPCVDDVTGQPQLSCQLCNGRGRIFRTPGPFQLRQEIVPHDNNGRVFPKKTPVVSGSATVYQRGTPLALSATQPADRSYIQLEAPFPRNYSRLTMDYTYDPEIPVTAEDSTVYGTNLLRVASPQFVTNGRDFEGSITGVTRVYNATKDETYTVDSYAKEYIYLTDMGTWESGDTLEVDYAYIKPFDFVLHSISKRRRYDSAYVIDSADATLISPYWAEVAPNDLITSLAVEIPAFSIINPTHSSGNDVVGDYFDLSRLTYVIDANGTEYTVGTDLELFSRNEIKWLVTKPTVKYTVHFLYHPTFVALTTYDTARHAENKSFVNRINVMMYDRVSRQENF